MSFGDFNITIRPFLFPSAAALANGGLVSPEQLSEPFEAGEFTGVDQAVFVTTKDFVGAPVVFRDGVLVLFGFVVSNTNEITFAVAVPIGTNITINYLAQI